MRTFKYHPDFPLGKIFDTTGETAPRPPEGGGWVEHRSELPKMTADQMIDKIVREELAGQGRDRFKLDLEHRKKFGEDPHSQATNAEVENVMSNRTPDGAGKVVPPKRAQFQRNFKSRL